MQAYALFAVIILTAVIFFSGMSLQNPAAIKINQDVTPPPVQASIVRPVEIAATSDSEEQDVAAVAVDNNATARPDVVPAVLPQTAVSILTAQDIEHSSAKLRGEVVAGQPALEALFFVYGYDESEVEEASERGSYQSVVDRSGRGLQTYRMTGNLNQSQKYGVSVRNLAPDTDYYARLCAQVVDGLRCSSVTSFATPPRVFSASSAYVPTFGTLSVEHISAEVVRLKGTVNMRDTQDGEVYVVYGESQSAVGAVLGDEYRDIDEDGDNLQRTRVASDIRGQRAMTETLIGLDDSTRHYYAWCVEYDGLRDGVVCSRMYSFTTHDEDYGLTPDINMSQPVVQGSKVQLSGQVDMDEFRNGRVFFVYGTASNVIAAVPGRTSFATVRQSGYQLQKQLVDVDLDRDDDYSLRLTNLQSNTLYFARLCVEYQNEDQNFRQSAFVACSVIEEFVTE